MDAPCNNLLLLICFLLSPFLSSVAPTSSTHDNFFPCFSSHLNHSKQALRVISFRNTSSYTTILRSSIRNLRFMNVSSKPILIVSPRSESHVQAAIICSRKSGLQVRTRSGGHDYEGLSYLSDQAYIVVDLSNMRNISIDVENETAWVGSGANLGEVYYRIAVASGVHGFPAGSCPTVGVGGHVSGGGFGTLFRKYGLAADNVVDAKLVDANGRVLDRESMGEDLFWAIRGGGGASFGVILSWKIRLVPVPPRVTVFNVARTLDQGGGLLLEKWQVLGSKLPEELFLHVLTEVLNVASNRTKTVRVDFDSLFLGEVDDLLPIVQARFPELGLRREDCNEMSWIQSVLYFAGLPVNGSWEALLNRTTQSEDFFKIKSDYVSKPISGTALKGMFDRLVLEETSVLILSPYGGKMAQIPDSEIPFPHRIGNLYGIQYSVTWDAEDETKEHLAWIRRLYEYMEPHVSKHPRAAYLNYRDLDLGRNNNLTTFTGFAKASAWGLKYFKGNFYRLARVKTKTDPSNFFRNEQSIPVLVSPRRT